MGNPRNAAAEELIRQTTQPDHDGDQAAGKHNGQSRGATTSRTGRGRGRRPNGKPEELKGKPRKVMIPDAEFKRLQMWSWKRGMTFSAVVTNLIKTYAPELELVTKSAPPADQSSSGQ
jgi:hypothetical protein